MLNMLMKVSVAAWYMDGNCTRLINTHRKLVTFEDQKWTKKTNYRLNADRNVNISPM